MIPTYELSRLDPATFEDLVNLLALNVLGAGHTGFGPGADGGRDGYFEGEAPYPSASNHWKGVWYLQSKFHPPHLSTDPQKWLLGTLRDELKAFQDPNARRTWPDNWIIATNIDPSGVPMTGAFDQARQLVANARPELASRFHIWGGSKLLGLLALHPEITSYYSHFLTPGPIFTTLYEHAHDSRPTVETILRFLVVRQFAEQQYTKLEQAGSDADTRPGIHHLFVDLPFLSPDYQFTGMTAAQLVRTTASCHRVRPTPSDTASWRLWNRHPRRSRIWVMRGGPGQGKSTVGQYYCQVQRAALILQDDCFPVTPQIRSLAVEVRDRAEALGYWPSLPRLPISIELRDYAQWFGQRSAGTPRGVLTYLAERLSAGVEESVLIGSLKRLLHAHSWFVTFDGLDEVPHDVKDEVAAEIVHFLTDVAIAAASDLFALCTSRPQGYSGQFAALDAPLVDLLPLTPHQALQCAAPVLTLGRPIDEAKASIQILTSAIESSSVQELMTTPLQSHIMAIVVRDGGKPPERRWQLYNNFYHVIKRREANRDLPDRRLAKVLREDTQLLRTVHTRLGFLLHARSETSKGAQTRLDRHEFSLLLTQAVSQMMDHDIESTVAVLMEATTNRLVLLNTPDDGNHLRFDIRPLQEFFAAEFLYESVDANALRDRIQLLAGDAHWREVMHFLLSALVESGRVTELVVAISTLEQLHVAYADTDARLLSRRLGRGALMAARLLQEGVLEQDKRMREQFRTCLQPLGGLLDLAAVDSLATIQAPNSSSWLLTFLVDILREADNTESVGAALILTRIITDDTPRASEIGELLSTCEPSYFAAVLRETISHHGSVFYSTPREVPSWLLCTVLKFLMRPDWRALRGAGVRASLGLLRLGRERTISAARQIGIVDETIELLRLLLTAEEIEDAAIQEVECGLLTARLFRQDWSSLADQSAELLPKEPTSVDDASGLLGLVCRVARFARMPTRHELLSILEFLQGDLELLHALPNRLRVLVPIDLDVDLATQISSLRQLQEAGFRELLRCDGMLSSTGIRRCVTGLKVNTECTREGWQLLLKTLPEWALPVWSDALWANFPKKTRPTIFDDPHAVEDLVDTVLSHPDVLRSAPELWAKLLSEAPAREAALRAAFLEASRGPVLDRQELGATFYPLALQLPSEAPLLPHLVNALVGSVRLTQHESREALEVLNRYVTRMVASPQSLRDLIGRQEPDASKRAAAIVLLLLHPQAEADLAAWWEELASCYWPEIGIWYFRAVRLCVMLRGSELDHGSRCLIGKLLDATREDYTARRELQALLAVWRETSHAPVSRAGVSDTWLNWG